MKPPKPAPKPDSKEFKDLQAKWYKKAGNFNGVNELGQAIPDVEQPDGNLKNWALSLIRHDEITENAKQDYYRLAGQLLHTFPFESKTERKIWEMHAEGLSIRDIAKKLKSQRIRAHKNGVHKVVQKIAAQLVNKCSSRKPS